MGEVIVMKKTISLLLIVLFSVCTLSACKNQSKQVTTENIQNALIEIGFKEAHTSDKYSVYIDNTETVSIFNSGTSLDLFNCDKNTNISKILDAVMPLYDNSFSLGDGEKVVQNLIKTRSVGDDSLTDGGGIEYGNCKYIEGLDETGEITVHLWIIIY